MRRAMIVIAAVVVALVVGSVAYASIPDSGGVIHGCRKNTDGSVRVIDTAAGQTCASGWTPLDWSQTGPQGPAGPAGTVPPGVISNVHPVSWTFGVPGDLSLWSAQASCADPSAVILGISGYAYYGGPDGHNLYQPLAFARLDQQRYLVFSPNDHAATASVDVICATAGS